MKQIFSLSLIAFWLVACGQSNNVTVIDAEKLLQLQVDGVPVIDVRTADEVEMGKIPGALNVTLSDEFTTMMKDFDKEKPVIVYCQSGRRSTMASKKLAESGYKVVYNYIGSFKDWTDQNRPVE